MLSDLKELWDEYVPAMGFFRKGMMDKPGATWDENYIRAEHRPQIEAAINNMVEEGAPNVDYHHYEGKRDPYKKILGKFNPEPVLLEDGTTAVRIQDEFDTNASNKHLSKEIAGNVLKNPLRAGWKMAETALKGRTDMVHGRGETMPGFDATIPISPELYAKLPGASAATPSAILLEKQLASVPSQRQIERNDYTVQSGDNLSAIAAKQGMTPEELAKINGIKNMNLINVGQSLRFR